MDDAVLGLVESVTAMPATLSPKPAGVSAPLSFGLVGVKVGTTVERRLTLARS